jgi:hypothetical protein
LGIYKIRYNLPKIGSKSKTNKTYFYFLEKEKRKPQSNPQPAGAARSLAVPVHSRPADAARAT